MSAVTLDHLRRHAVARSLFRPTTLGRAIGMLGFVQADPIRAPARAQDLTLRHRVTGYRAGDLERRYRKLGIEEDALVNYGFVPRATLALLHPRVARRAWDVETERRAAEVLAFVAARGPTHPRDVLAAFAHGRVTGYWGGALNASTQLLDGMHYRGLLRVAWRENGTRVYEAIEHALPETSAEERARALVDLVVRKYSPLPSASLGYLASLLGYGAPHLRAEICAALAEARRALPGARIDGTHWLWREDENPRSRRWRPDEDVRLLAPFDPIVWDRRRFALPWGREYRFEAYTPAAKRRFGHYALPMLWGDRVIGWASVAFRGGKIDARFGYAEAQPRSPAFRHALDLELDRLRAFLDAAED